MQIKMIIGASLLLVAFLPLAALLLSAILIAIRELRWGNPVPLLVLAWLVVFGLLLAIYVLIYGG